MADMKSLAKDTAIYGVSSILGRFLNWCLLPFYSYMLESPKDYGMVTDLYNWTAVMYILLTYGMETGFFRFVNKPEEEAKKRLFNHLVQRCNYIPVLHCRLLVVQFAHLCSDGIWEPSGIHLDHVCHRSHRRIQCHSLCLPPLQETSHRICHA